MLKQQSKREVKDRWDKTLYIDQTVNNKHEVMRKLHRVTYSELFDSKFDTRNIDE